MRLRQYSLAVLTFALLAGGVAWADTARTSEAANPPQLELIGRFDSGLGAGATEIVAFEYGRLYTVNAAANSVDIIDFDDLSQPLLTIDMSPWGAGVNSVAIKHGILAVAVEADPVTDPGRIVFFDRGGNYLADAPAGALPDMVAFSPNGLWAVAANEGEAQSYEEGEPNPEGSITIINVWPYIFLSKFGLSGWFPGFVRQVSFSDFNEGGSRHEELSDLVRIYSPGATVAQDLEPEYVTIPGTGRYAYVTLQEANAVAVIDIWLARVDAILPLGAKDYNLEGNGLDASDREISSSQGAINIANWPVKGWYQPDTIASYKSGSQTYLVTANEGDTRNFEGFNEEIRVGAGGYTLCADVFPNAATLKQNANLGRLTVTTADGLRETGDGAPCYEEIYTFGGRSFSIWDTAGNLVYDSGDDLEQRTAEAFPDFFNSDNEEDNFDNRSDNKGPEPEAVAVGFVQGRWYAFVGLERIGGVAVYDITDPANVTFVQYLNTRLFDDSVGPDSGPEGVIFIDRQQSPTRKPLVMVSYEISGTVAVFEFD